MAKCKGCGAEIIWAKNENGKMIPLDAKAPVYALIIGQNIRDARCEKSHSPRAYVTHFATCSKANEFSGSKKK